jgi:hypothetical protein
MRYRLRWRASRHPPHSEHDAAIRPIQWPIGIVFSNRTKPASPAIRKRFMMPPKNNRPIKNQQHGGERSCAHLPRRLRSWLCAVPPITARAATGSCTPRCRPQSGYRAIEGADACRSERSLPIGLARAHHGKNAAPADSRAGPATSESAARAISTAARGARAASGFRARAGRFRPALRSTTKDRVST